MTFETKLSREAIKQRLFIFANPINFSNCLSEHTLLFKWNKDNSFYLLKTGGYSMRPILPFVGKIDAQDSSTYIIGKFDLTKSEKVMLACFFGFAWILVLFSCLLNSNFDIAGKTIIFTFVAFWTISGYAFIKYFPPLLQKKQQAAVIEFINQYLLD